MRLIALSGWGKEEDEALSAQAGFDLAALGQELRRAEAA